MPVRPPAWQRRPISMTSLIDIIFLLLLFFMLSSTFTRFGEIPLMNANGGGAADRGPPVFLQLRPDTVVLNGDPVTFDDVITRLSENNDGSDAQVVLVTVGAEVTSQRLIDLLARLRDAPDLVVSVLE